MLWLDSTTLSRMQAEAAAGHADWLAIRGTADSYAGGTVRYPDEGYSFTSPPAIVTGYQGAYLPRCLMTLLVGWAICKDGFDNDRAASYLAQAKLTALRMCDDSRLYTSAGHTLRSWAQDDGFPVKFWQYMLLAYNWLFSEFTESERLEIITAINNFIEYFRAEGYMGPGYTYTIPASNYYAGYYSAVGLTVALTPDENPDIADYTNHWFNELHGGTITGQDQTKIYFNERMAGGGGWPEGWNYGFGAIYNFFFPIIAQKQMYDTDLVADGHTWVTDEVRSFFYDIWPDFSTFADENHTQTTGPLESATPGVSSGITLLMPYISRMFSGDSTLNGRIQKFCAEIIASVGVGYDTRWMRQLFWDENATEASYTSLPLSYLASGMGVFTSRSSWDTDATWLRVVNGRNASASTHAYPDAGGLAICKNGKPLLLNPTGWMMRGMSNVTGFMAAAGSTDTVINAHASDAASTNLAVAWPAGRRLYTPDGSALVSSVDGAAITLASALPAAPDAGDYCYGARTWETVTALDRTGIVNKYYNIYYPMRTGGTYLGQTVQDWDETHPSISIHDESETYAYARANDIYWHYRDGTAATRTGKMAAAWARDIVHLRPDIVVAYDRTTRGEYATAGEQMRWHVEAAEAIGSQPSGNTRHDVTADTHEDLTTVFVGAVQTIFPASCTVNIANLRYDAGVSRTYGGSETGRDGVCLEVTPPGSDASRTWLTVFECATETGNVHTATGFTGTYHDGVEVDTWAVCFPKALTGFGANLPTYTVTTASLDHLVFGLAASTGYSVACKNLGGSTLRTLTPTSNDHGTLAFSAAPNEVTFAITVA